MSGGAEALAELASGVAVARELSPSSAAGHGHGACPNCGTTLLGEFCHGCGQPAHLHRSFAAIGHELAHGVFHFEGRTWHTLPLLAWRPGELTRRYIHGERARFVSPFALFLFAVFLMFATFHAVGGPFGGGSIADLKVGGQQAKALDHQIHAGRGELERRLADLEGRRDKAMVAGTDHAALDREIDGARHDIGVLDRTAAIAGAAGGVAEGNTIDLGVPWLNAVVERAAANPQLLAYKLQSNAYKFSWLLIPLSLPFIWLAFAWRRDLAMYDHAIFATHSLSFMTLMFVVLSWGAAAGLSAGWAGLALSVVPPVHLYRHLRGAYLVGRFGALWRTVWLLFSAGVAALIFALLLLSMGLSD